MVTRVVDTNGREFYCIKDVGHEGWIDGIKLNELINLVEDIARVVPKAELMSMGHICDVEEMTRDGYDG